MTEEDPPPTLPPPSTDPLPKTAPPEKEDVGTVLKGMDLEDEAAVKPFHVRFFCSSERAISPTTQTQTSGIHWYLECECKTTQC